MGSNWAKPAVVLSLCLCIMAYLAGRGRVVSGRYVHSQYRNGVLIMRSVLPSAAPLGPSDTVLEVTEESGPVLRGLLRFVATAETDGVHVRCAKGDAYITNEDLRAASAYESTGFGVKLDAIERLAAEFVSAEGLRGCTWQRVRYRAAPKPLALSYEAAKTSAREGARFLVRNMSSEGKFAYSIEGHTGVVADDYNWPRHAGTLAFLARAGRELDEPRLLEAALRAEQYMRANAYRTCAGEPCVADADTAYLGSSALALTGLVELVRAGETRFSPDVAAFARGIRGAQRSDGEFMHVFHLDKGKAEDIQYPYYSGEAVYALALAYEVTRAPEDLEAAERGLAHLVGAAWKFFGSDYYRAEEHWTCQAMARLWQYTKNETALSFCSSWFAVQERQLAPSGGFTPVSIVTPRLTPAASRTEASLAIASVLRAERRNTEQLDTQIGLSLSLLVRAQFLPGPSQLFANADQMLGGTPGSLGDLNVRIDYVQHAGSAMLAYLSYMQASRLDPQKIQ